MERDRREGARGDTKEKVWREGRTERGLRGKRRASYNTGSGRTRGKETGGREGGRGDTEEKGSRGREGGGSSEGRVREKGGGRVRGGRVRERLHITVGQVGKKVRAFFFFNCSL